MKGSEQGTRATMRLVSIARRAALAAVAFGSLSACDPWGKYDNPADPAAKGYQGYETVARAEQVRILSPAPGEALGDPIITVSKVEGALRYGIRIGASADEIETAPRFEKLDYPTNVLDLSGSGIEDATTYFVRIGAAGSEGSWGWSSASAVATRWRVAAAPPTFSPNGGTFDSDLEVSISAATPGAAIRYTTDGSAPGAGSSLFDAAAPIPVKGQGAVVTIKAIALKTGLAASAPSTATYTINWSTTSSPQFSPAAGTYAADQSVSIRCATKNAAIYYTASATGTPPDPTVLSTPFDPASPISAAGNGTVLRIKALAVKAGMTESTIESAAYQIAYPRAAVPTFDPPGGTFDRDLAVAITCGTPDSIIHFTTNGDEPTTASAAYSGTIAVAGNGTTMTIKAIATAPGCAASEPGSQTYSVVDPLAATPTFSPESGTLKSGQGLSIACSTPNSTIYYTLDGSDPASSGTRRSGASPVVPLSDLAASGTTLRAVATAAGYVSSTERSAVFSRGYDLGELGPAGGKVFYDKGNYDGGWRYLEAAPGDQSPGISWGDLNTETGAVGLPIGTGKANTATILPFLSGGTYAASLCAQSINGFSDWFLPSRDELNQMYLQRTLIGGFSSAFYWTSSENATTAGIQDFGTGEKAFGYKNWGGPRVRAIRWF